MNPSIYLSTCLSVYSCVCYDLFFSSNYYLLQFIAIYDCPFLCIFSHYYFLLSITISCYLRLFFFYNLLQSYDLLLSVAIYYYVTIYCYLYPSICQSVSQSICRIDYLCTYLVACLSLLLTIYPMIDPIYLPIYLPTYLSI